MIDDGWTGGSNFASVSAIWVIDFVRSSSSPSVASWGAPRITRVITSRPPTDSISPHCASLPARNRQYFIASPRQRGPPVHHEGPQGGTNINHQQPPS